MSTLSELRQNIAQQLECRVSNIRTHQGKDGQWHAIVQHYASLKYQTPEEALEDLLQQVSAETAEVSV